MYMSGIQIIIDITLCYQNASDNMLQRIMQAEMRIIYEQKATACQAQRAAATFMDTHRIMLHPFSE